jgi:hypothetical protein
MLYGGVIKDMSQTLQQSMRDFQGFTVRGIPKPETLAAPLVAPTEYNRLAVAYGLSFSADEIGEIIPEGKVPPIALQRAASDPSDRFVSKDQV